MNLQKRTWIDNDIFPAPVNLDGFVPSELSIRILQNIAEALQTYPFLVGGALASEFKRLTPRDRDIHFDIADTNIAKALGKQAPIEEVIERIKQRLLDIEGATLFSDTFRREELYFGAVARLGVSFESAAVDISLVNKKMRLEDAAMYGDATVTSCAMDHRGNALFHPRFEPDMENQTWSIRVTKESDKKTSARRCKAKRQLPNSAFYNFSWAWPEEYRATLEI